MSYKGKSSAAALAVIAAVYAAYFVWALRPGRNPASVIVHMVGTVFILAAAMIALEASIAIRGRAAHHRPTLQDERDAAIGARSARNGYYAIMACAWFMPVLALSSASSVTVANCFLGIIVLAEIVHFGSRVVYDLRGV